MVKCFDLYNTHVCIMSTLKKTSSVIVRKSRSPKYRSPEAKPRPKKTPSKSPSRSPRPSRISKNKPAKSPHLSPSKKSRESKYRDESIVTRKKPSERKTELYSSRRIKRSSSVPRKDSPRSPRITEKTRFPPLRRERKKSPPKSPSEFQVYHTKRRGNQVMVNVDTDLAKKLQNVKIS